MEKIFEKIKTNPLFKGIDSCDFKALMQCSGGRARAYKKGESILLSGSPVENIGLVATGRVHIVRQDAQGKPHLLAELVESELFAEALACVGAAHSPVSVEAADDCEILFINYRRVISICPSACRFHTKLIENMLAIIAQKNLMLNQKAEILSKRTTRERLVLFFDAQRAGKREFKIPYNREELAAYLCVERSALSAELSRMRAEGLIDFERSEFKILK